MEYSKTYIAIPPGETIKEILDDRNISQKDFAIRMDYSEKHISRLINGLVELTSDTAEKLEYVLGMPATFWSGLEADYRSKLAKVRAELELQAEEDFIKKIPYSTLAAVGWLPVTRKKTEKIINLRKFFEVASLNVLDTLNFSKKISFRKLKDTEKSNYLALAWCQKARLEAREQELKTLDLKKLKSMLLKLKHMAAVARPDLSSLKQLLNDCGIALVVLPQLQGSGIHGASFTIGNKIVLGLTDRRKTADVFCFSLFHELGHIIHGDFRDNEQLSEEKENKADEFAKNFLITAENYRSFVEKKDFSALAIKVFAKQEEIDSGIVVGRLQREHLIGYNELNCLKNDLCLTA